MSDTESHLVLLGHPPVTEFLGYVTTQTVEGRNGDHGALMDAWRRANDHLLTIAETEAGYADEIELGTMPEELAPLVDRALADPVMRRDWSLAPVSIEWIELDRLVVHQKHLNLSFAESLAADIGASPSPRTVFDFALPYEKRRDPPIQSARVGEASWIFKSVSNDLRILDAELLDPADVRGFATGVPSVVVALSLGYGSNYLSALSVGGRLVLHNGSHRAYALRAAGETHVPCLVQHISRREELRAMVGDEHPLMAEGAESILTTPRPPLFKDYFDDALRMVFSVPRSVRQVQIGFNLSVTDMPA